MIIKEKNIWIEAIGESVTSLEQWSIVDTKQSWNKPVTVVSNIEDLEQQLQSDNFIPCYGFSRIFFVILMYYVPICKVN